MNAAEQQIKDWHEAGISSFLSELDEIEAEMLEKIKRTAA